VAPKPEPDHTGELLRERRSQVRGLLILGGVVLLFLLARSGPLHLFHSGWWRL
jgi:hypothetical protein